MLKNSIEELGDIYLRCSTHLFENFARAGISHLWENKPNTPRGGAIFTYYDAEKTCLRQMPNAPKFFQASIRNGLISHSDALTLIHELLTTVGVLLDGYSGFFATEMKSGPLGQCIRYAAEPHARSILAVHQNLDPDGLYAAMPWPLIAGLHFRLGSFARAGVQGNYIEEASQDLLRAISIAIDIATFGAGLNMKMEGLLARLNWMKGGRRSRLTVANEENLDLRKILIPCFTGGFQGITFGLFSDLSPDLENFAISQLHEFSSAIGENIAKCRERDCALMLAQSSSLSQYARAFINLLPPFEHATFVAGNEKLGLKLVREGDFLGGYRTIRGEELNASLLDPANQHITSPGADQQPQIRIKFSSELEALSPVFTTLRLMPYLAELPSLMESEDVKPLSRAELGSLYHGLKRQLRDGRGAMAASKKLFLLEAALQDFDAGETTLTNSKARLYTERMLGKPNLSYHVAGKAARKFEEDIRKLMPERFLFESVSAHSVRVRWRPAKDHAGTSEKAPPHRG